MAIQNFLCPHCLCSPDSIQTFCAQESCPQFIDPFNKICIHLHHFCPKHCSWNDYINYYKLFLNSYYNSYHVAIFAFYYKYLTDMMYKCQCNQSENVKAEKDVKSNKNSNIVSGQESKNNTQFEKNNITCPCNVNAKYPCKVSANYKHNANAKCQCNVDTKCKCNVDAKCQCNIKAKCHCNITQTNRESLLECGDCCEEKDSVCYEIIFSKHKNKKYCIKNLRTATQSSTLSEEKKTIRVSDLSFKSNDDENIKYWVKKLETELLPSSSSESDLTLKSYRDKSFINNANNKDKHSIINLYHNKKICTCDISNTSTQTDMISKDLLLEYIKENNKLKKELKSDICTKCKEIDQKLKFYEVENNILQRELADVRTKLSNLKDIIKENCEAVTTKSHKIIQTLYHCPHLTQICTQEDMTSTSLVFLHSKDTLSDTWDNASMKTESGTSNGNISAITKSDWSSVSQNKKNIINKKLNTRSAPGTFEISPKYDKSSLLVEPQNKCNCTKPCLCKNFLNSTLEVADDNFGLMADPQTSKSSYKSHCPCESYINSTSEAADDKSSLMAEPGSFKCSCAERFPYKSYANSNSEIEDDESIENAGSKFHLFDEITMTSSQSFEILSSVKKKGKGNVSYPKTDFAIYVYDEDKEKITVQRNK